MARKRTTPRPRRIPFNRRSGRPRLAHMGGSGPVTGRVLTLFFTDEVPLRESQLRPA